MNYRGSIGFGNDSVYSLPGNVGDQDVKDVQVQFFLYNKVNFIIFTRDLILIMPANPLVGEFYNLANIKDEIEKAD